MNTKLISESISSEEAVFLLAVVVENGEELSRKLSSESYLKKKKDMKESKWN